MRHIDQKNVMHADDYRAKVSNALTHHQNYSKLASYHLHLNPVEIQSASTLNQLFVPSKSQSPTKHHVHH